LPEKLAVITYIQSRVKCILGISIKNNVCVCKHLSIFVGSGANFLKIHLECINFGNRKKIPKGMHGVLNGDVGLRKYPHNLMWIMPTEGCMNK